MCSATFISVSQSEPDHESKIQEQVSKQRFRRQAAVDVVAQTTEGMITRILTAASLFGAFQAFQVGPNLGILGSLLVAALGYYAGATFDTGLVIQLEEVPKGEK